ncbi:hypothetical protein B0H10DRAFT_2243709 [Mycena sp. CBHHK59/15]|nr:hypothetical protein B0H10DRAFT_2243709 [Mycena sp. CBHHK59/15]
MPLRNTIKYTNSLSMKRFMMNSGALVHVQLEQEQTSKLFEEQSVEPEQSGLSEAEREREAEEELDVEAQTRSRAEDIARQI